jgi:hypothetical protein
LTIRLPTTKVGNWPDLLKCRWRVTRHWKALDEGYNFSFDLISIQGLHAKLWAPKVAGVPTLANSGPPLGSPGTKCHLDVGLVKRHKVYYKGEGGGFPQVRAVVNLVNPNCSWLVLTPKVLPLCTNHFVLVLCRSVWVVEVCQFFLVPSRSSSTPLYPSKVLRAKERAPTPYYSISYIWDSHLSPSRSWERVIYQHQGLFLLMIKSCAYLHEWFDLLEHMCVCLFRNVFSKNHVEMEKTFSHA